MKLVVLVASAVLVLVVPTGWLPVLVAVLALVALVGLAAPARRTLASFAALTMTLAGFFYAALGPAPDRVVFGPWGLSGADFANGLAAGARLASLFAVFVLGARWIPARDLLPYTARSGLVSFAVGSLLRLVPTLEADAKRLREAQAARGHRFRQGLRGAPSWIPLVVPLFVTTLRRARDQALALYLAGLAPDGPRETTPGRRAHRWSLVVTLAALAIAGRLLLVALPGVSLSFFVLFIAGVAFGPRVGLFVGLLSRLATDLLLSGLNPIFLPMAPVDGLLGFLAGLLGQRVNFGQRSREPLAYAAVLAGTLGWTMTVVFSVAADSATWIFFRWVLPQPGVADALWTVLILRGVLFNVPAMIFNAALFGVATYPVLRALRASGALVANEPTEPRSTASTSA